MLTYVLRRLVLMIPTLIGITFVIFMVMALAPGGVGASLLQEEQGMRPEERKALREYYNQRYGLDKPLLVQYGRWLSHAAPVGAWTDPPGQRSGWGLTFRRRPDGSADRFGLKVPDLGDSRVRGQKVWDVIRDAVPVTLLLNLIAIPIIYAVAIPSGIRAAHQRGRTFDVVSGVAFIALWSLPSMWVGVLLLTFLANRDLLQWFPVGNLHDTQAGLMPFLPRSGEQGLQRGWLVDTAWHLVLPVICYTYAGFAFLTKLMRASVLESLSADFVRTARAKGLEDRVVLYRHVLRNSLLPLITVAAAILPGLLGGSVVIESIFSLNGMGKLMVDAIFQRDAEVILGDALVVSVISLLSLLLADLLYAAADPRVAYE